MLMMLALVGCSVDGGVRMDASPLPPNTETPTAASAPPSVEPSETASPTSTAVPGFMSQTPTNTPDYSGFVLPDFYEPVSWISGDNHILDASDDWRWVFLCCEDNNLYLLNTVTGDQITFAESGT